jgi:hypothetical protein
MIHVFIFFCNLIDNPGPIDKNGSLIYVGLQHILSDSYCLPPDSTFPQLKFIDNLVEVSAGLPFGAEAFRRKIIAERRLHKAARFRFTISATQIQTV